MEIICYGSNRDQTQTHDSDSGKSIQSQFLFVTRWINNSAGGKEWHAGESRGTWGEVAVAGEWSPFARRPLCNGSAACPRILRPAGDLIARWKARGWDRGAPEHQQAGKRRELKTPTGKVVGC